LLLRADSHTEGSLNAPLLDVDLFYEKERYPHRIRTPGLTKGFCFSDSMAYDDPTRSSPIPANKMPVVPAEVRQFAPRNGRMGALPNVEIPGFLKRGPRAAEDLAIFDRHRGKAPESDFSSG
jgi:hypothetical protein